LYWAESTELIYFTTLEDTMKKSSRDLFLRVLPKGAYVKVFFPGVTIYTAPCG
jgi:hypothetical protein